MIPLHRLSCRLVLTTVLPLLAIPLASGAPVRSQRPRATMPVPVKPNDTIIPLPLNPVVPAGQRLCSAQAPSGLKYTMLRLGSGAKPTQGDVVLVNYIGYLAATGAVFDQGTRSPLPVTGVISGFSQGLQMMARAGIARFCIPAAMGYGAQASGPIPANADLVFQVELVDFKSAAEVERMNGAPPAEPSPATTPAPQP